MSEILVKMVEEVIKFRHTGAAGLGTAVIVVGASSLPSNRFDIAPLCQVVVPPVPRERVSDMGTIGPLPFTYIDAFPFPGRVAGRRLTMTDDERGMIYESSLNSECHDLSRAVVSRQSTATHLVLTQHRKCRDQSHLPYSYYWQE